MKMPGWIPLSCCCISLAAGVLCWGQTATAPSAAKGPQLAGIAHVAIRVGDLKASREFYRKLGYEEAFALDKGGSPTEAFFKINDRQFLELYPQRKPDQPIGFLHVCFEARDLSAVNRAYAERGLNPTPVKRAGAGNLLFTMRGPEQQNIEYTQYMPGSRHTLDIGKHLGSNRIADAIAGVGISMQDVSAADAFYADRMGFLPQWKAGGTDANVFRIPGDPRETIEILPKNREPRFHLLLAVANLNNARKELKDRDIPAQHRRGKLVIHDPDGNVILLVKAPPGARPAL